MSRFQFPVQTRVQIVAQGMFALLYAGQCSLLQALLACREEGAAQARGPGICEALEYAVPLPPKPGILSEVI